ncbi:MAG: class I SAM-dependent methyltransferase [Acidobacteria bacterium]|nr:class I SAM-dependent methyltransferase [Acidobacteriota bacterium]
MSVSRYYTWLTRFQDVARGLAHDTGQRTLTVHRHLRADDGTVSGDVLHECLLDALSATTDAATPVTLDVLDAGCGLGGTIFFLHERLGGRYTGITLSEDQRLRAASAAARRATGDACRFAVRDYDTDLTDLVPGGVDLVIAVESLAHAPDPAATIARLGARLRPGGRLLVVDDVPHDDLARDDADFAAFRAGWLAPSIASDAHLSSALARAGLVVIHDVDLTPRLPERRPAVLAALVWLSDLVAWLARAMPGGLLVGALHGGLRLERLYRRRQVRYRLIVARRPGRGPAKQSRALPGSTTHGGVSSPAG